jgi:hypothetical protein
MILGNDLAGSKVWADGKLNICKSNLQCHLQGNRRIKTVSPEVFPICAVTRADSRKEIESKPKSLELPVKLQTEQLTSSRDSLMAEQKANTTLADLFDKVVPDSVVRNSALFSSVWAVGQEMGSTL